MGIVEVAVVIAAGAALASVLCWLIYSVASGEVDHGSDDRHGDSLRSDRWGRTGWPPGDGNRWSGRL